MSTFLLALILGIIAGLQMVFSLSGLPVREPIITGVMTGLFVGDVKLGLEIGATLSLMSLGFYTFGGASIPDYTVGCMLGVVAASEGGGIEVGLAVAVPAALLMSQLDILGRASTTVFQHGADRALAQNSVRKFEIWTLLGTLPWALSRAIPVFTAILLGKDFIEGIAEITPAYVTTALRFVGAILPAVGFALLLSYMDVRKYWPFMLIGYVLFAYLGMGTLGLAIIGLAIGYLFSFKEGGKVNG